jgi:prepilin-type N-terminal cleavage/methylation domain-containing protein
VSNFCNSGRRCARGFTLIEVLISMAVLVTLTGAIFEQINQMQKKASSESIKVDMGQQSHEFVDQITRDLHTAGYPNAAMYAAPLDATSDQVAAGLVAVSPTHILLEGDVTGDGKVSSVNIDYVAADANDPSCPCVRRSAGIKVPGSPLSQPQAAVYSEISQVVPPGTGAGQSGEDLFAFYDQNGNPVPLSDSADVTDPTTIAQISTVKINVSLLASTPDPANGAPMRTSISATARVSH